MGKIKVTLDQSGAAAVLSLSVLTQGSAAGFGGAHARPRLAAFVRLRRFFRNERAFTWKTFAFVCLFVCLFVCCCWVLLICFLPIELFPLSV